MLEELMLSTIVSKSQWLHYLFILKKCVDISLKFHYFSRGSFSSIEIKFYFNLLKQKSNSFFLPFKF